MDNKKYILVSPNGDTVNKEYVMLFPDGNILTASFPGNLTIFKVFNILTNGSIENIDENSTDPVHVIKGTDLCMVSYDKIIVPRRLTNDQIMNMMMLIKQNKISYDTLIALNECLNSNIVKASRLKSEFVFNHIVTGSTKKKYASINHNGEDV